MRRRATNPLAQLARVKQRRHLSTWTPFLRAPGARTYSGLDLWKGAIAGCSPCAAAAVFLARQRGAPCTRTSSEYSVLRLLTLGLPCASFQNIRGTPRRRPWRHLLFSADA